MSEQPARQLVLIVGASTSAVCGVRDHDAVLRAQMSAQGIPTLSVWWERDLSDGPWETRCGCRAWLGRVAAVVEQERPAALLWHYTGFMYAYRGVPALVPQIARELGRGPAPLIGLLHELAHPYGEDGLRGAVWAVTQRAGLRSVAAACAALVVTTEDRLEWLAAQRWLPPRPIRHSPVFSNFPDLPREAVERNEGLNLGVFGYGSPTFAPEPVVAALATLRRRGRSVSLTLIGAPGSDSLAAQAWLDAARSAGCHEAVRITDVLDPERVVAELDAADLVVYPDRVGPSGRKGTLAAVLARGRPIVAFGGPAQWRDVVDAGAVRVVGDRSTELAALLEELADSPEQRRELGRRARTFYESRLDPSRAARTIADLLSEVERNGNRR